MKSTLLLGQRVDCLTFKDVFLLVKKMVENKAQKKISLFFPININILLQLKRESDIKKQYEQADIIFADGVPLVWFSHIKKYSSNIIPERISGTDLVEKILQTNGFKIFIFGSTSEVLKTISQKFTDQIVGMDSPTAEQVSSVKYSKSIIKSIKNSGANIVLVALGPLKQEKWLLNNLQNNQLLDRGLVGIAVGSALDIISGEFSRAPKVLKNNGLEWLWRVVLEPKRLFKRYFCDFINLSKLLMKFKK